MAPNNVNEYYLQRNFHATSRLNAQHQTHSQIQGYLVHPKVPLGDSAKIADVGTGTAVWPLDLARKLPASTAIRGFDISLAQTPHEEWLPKNVSMHEWDLHQPVPPKFRADHDLTHARFFIQVVHNGDSGAVLEQLKLLTKPGGYIQWTEPNVWSIRLEKASDNIDARSSEELCGRMRDFLIQRAGSAPGWGPGLPDTFKAHGLEEIHVDHFTTPPDLRPNSHDNVLLTLEEISTFVPDGDEIRQLIDRAAAEIGASRRGIAIVMDSLTVIGRVPG